MERVEYDFKVFDNFIEITPKNGIKDNSIYEIRIKSIKALNKNKQADGYSLKVCTKLTPSYCSLEAVHSLVESYQVPEEKTLYYIREASLFAEYVKKTSYNENDVPFEVIQYVKHKAAYDSLMKFYIERSAESGSKGSLGEITFENSSTFPAMKDLLGVLKEDVKKWEDHLRGNGFEGRAKPLSVIKGIKADAPYGTVMSGYSRDVGGR